MTDPAPELPRVELDPAALAAARRLLELTLDLGTPRDIGSLLGAILDATTDLLDCGRATVLLYDTASGDLRFVAATGEDTATLAHIPVPLHESLAGTAFRDNRAVVAHDVLRDARHFAAPAEATGYRPRAIAAVPMRIADAPVGVLQALDPHAGAFSEADLDVLADVAAQAAVAVHAARARHAAERERARLADDLARLRDGVAAVAAGLPAGSDARQALDALLEAGR